MADKAKKAEGEKKDPSKEKKNAEEKEPEMVCFCGVGLWSDITLYHSEAAWDTIVLRLIIE